MKVIVTVALLAAVSTAQAQSPAPGTAAKPVRTLSVRPDGSMAPSRPAVQTPADTAGALATPERMALQSDLAWVGAYNGAVNGEVSERMIAAIKSWQKDHGSKPTGVLNPQERAALSADAKTLQDHAGWKIGLDPVNGIKLGLPGKLAPLQSAGASGTRWSSAQGQIQIETWRVKDANLTIAAVAEREKKEAGRKVDYSVVKPDFFVLSGLQGLKKFYVRGQIKGSEVRGLTILYDQATEGTMEPVVIAMSSAFAPFGGDSALTPAPPPRKKVEYATGLVVGADGAILTDRSAVDGCDVVVVAGLGPAERVADDAAHDLALLRVYGAGPLTPVGPAATPQRPEVSITGIADPQNQGGGSAVSVMAARLVTAGGDVRLDPAPGLGFSGAAVTDAAGQLAGIALLRAASVAGPAPAQSEAKVVAAEVVRGFLAGAKIVPASGAALAKASVLRVICVRK